jgi:hypothetical protein
MIPSNENTPENGEDMVSEDSGDSPFNREKWRADVRLRERELAVKEREQEIKSREVDAKVEELRRSRWSNPLVLAVFAAAVAAAGNFVITWVNGVQQRAQDERRATAENELEQTKAKGQQQLEEGKAEAARILEVIKTNNPDRAAVNLAFLLQTGLIASEDRRKSLATYLANRQAGEGATLPTPASTEDIYIKGFSSKDQAAITKQLRDFRSYLQSLGYNPPAKSLQVEFDPTEAANAHYSREGHKIVIGPDLINMPDVLFREYSQGVLDEVNPSYLTSAGWKVDALGSGLADYFPCSYLGDPKFGKASIGLFRKLAPWEFANKDSLRDLTTKRRFVTSADGPMMTEQHHAGEVWAAAAWDLRIILGCPEGIPKCPTADKIILESWKDLSFNPAETVDVRFAENIVNNVQTTVGSTGFSSSAGRVSPAVIV